MKHFSYVRFAVSAFALLATLGCAQVEVDRAEQVYREINGIARDTHREIRQTLGTRVNTEPLETFRAKYDLSPRSSNCPVFFAQPNVTPRFSPDGSFRMAPLDDIASKLRSGELSPDAVVIHFVWVNGRRVTLNNRSLTVLYKAGKAPTRLVDRTADIPPKGPDSVDELLRRLEGMGGLPSTEMLIRTAGVGRDGKTKKDSDWDAPIGEIVSMPPALLKQAWACYAR